MSLDPPGTPVGSVSGLVGVVSTAVETVRAVRPVVVGPPVELATVLDGRVEASGVEVVPSGPGGADSSVAEMLGSVVASSLPQAASAASTTTATPRTGRQV